MILILSRSTPLPLFSNDKGVSRVRFSARSTSNDEPSRNVIDRSAPSLVRNAVAVVEQIKRRLTDETDHVLAGQCGARDAADDAQIGCGKTIAHVFDDQVGDGLSPSSRLGQFGRFGSKR